MELILIIVIGYFIFKKFKKKDKEEKVVNAEPPKPGSRAEKKMLKEQERERKELEREKAEFKNKLKDATGRYGYYQIKAMNYLANAYKEGRVVEKDIEKAKYWAEQEFYAMVDKKFYVESHYGAYRYDPNIDFFLKEETKDLTKAEELAWSLYRNGTLSAKAYILKVMQAKYPDKTEEELAIDGICAIDPLATQARRERSKEVYEEFKAELKNAGKDGQKALIELLLKKADVDVEVKAVAFPGATAELEKLFSNARWLEAKGNDYKKVMEAYEPVAEAGHSEAMRRLGLIMRDIVSEDCTTEVYAKGEAWLKKSAEAGNGLAAYNLDSKNVDMEYLAGLAGQGNLEALYALGCILSDKWEVSHAIFRNMEELIGDPIAKKDGEGMEWLCKLGPKFYIYAPAYYEKYAQAGHEIGYALSTVRLILLSRVMLEGAVNRFGNKAGEYGDFSYIRYVEQVSQPARDAGVARATAIWKGLRSEGYEFSSYRRDSLEDAKNARGTWKYNSYDMTPEQRVAKQATIIHHDSLAMYYTRKGTGMNFSEIREEVCKSSDGSLTSTSSPMDEFKANQSCKNMPYLIYDDANNTWKQMHAYDNTAVYRNDELGEETITYCDISSKYATGYSRTFHWW